MKSNVINNNVIKNNIIKDNITKIKTFIEKIPKKKRLIIGISSVSVILVAIILTVLMNSQASGKKYTVLYTGLSTSETGSIYQVLNEMGADVKFDSKGEIMVPQNEYDIWILQLAAKGYPKTALTYDVFSSNAGMTATESEKAQWLLYQLQDRIQATLERIDGVASATVTITIPDSSNYVWETATNEQSASAGVLLSLDPGKTMSGEQVSAIRNLIASSVPKMKPENVSVVDAATMLELTPDNGSSNETTSNMGFELMVQKQIEDNVTRLLTPRYGQGGVVAVAKVTIDYDKMMTEKMELTPATDNSGNVTHAEGSYSVKGTEAAGNVVGAQNNTDIPQYAYNSPTASGGMTDYSWKTDYDYSYIKTQIQSGNAILKRATISVMVDESSMSDARVTELKNLVSTCTDIPVELISVSAFKKAALNEAPEPSPTTSPEKETTTHTSIFANIFKLPLWAYIAMGVGLLLLLTGVFVFIIMMKRKKKNRLNKQLEAEERAKAEEARRKQVEIDNYKKTLEDIAKGNIDPKNEAIVEEVRDFAKTNPEIAANLIRSWLKES